MLSAKKPAVALLAAFVLLGSAAAQMRGRTLSQGAKPTAVQTAPQPEQPAPLTMPEQMPPTPPDVSYRNGLLSIVARNSTLADVIDAVRAQTGAVIETPANAGKERVMSRLGPAPPQEVLAELLNGSSYDFVILGNASGGLQHVILTQRTGGVEEPASTAARTAGGRQPARRPVPVVEEEEPAEEPALEETPDESREVPEDVPLPVPTPNLPPGAVQPGQQMPGQTPTQPQPVPGQPQVKTPEQLLEDLRRLQQQQQQQQQPQPAPQPE
jgi:hypothetical protein